MLIKVNMDKNSVISFMPFKKAVYEICDFDKIPEEYIRAIRFLNIFPKDKSINYSLTSSMNKRSQIRYYTKNRLYRSLKSIVALLQMCDNFLQIEIYNSKYIDEGTKIFIDIINSLKSSNIIIKKIESENPEYGIECYTDDEKRIIEIFEKKNVEVEDIVFLIDKADEYVNLGDYITAKRILHFVEKIETNSNVFSILATAYTMEEDIKNALNYLKLWYEYGNIYEKAHACYSLGMLYARHMDRSLENDEIARHYLEEGYTLLNKIKKVDSNSLLKDKLFNRNGMALLYFRYGEIDRAIAVEKEAIASLEKLSDETALLQKSVLMYNLAQCYAQKKEYENSISVYEDLLKIDPYFPEYSMEQAKNYIELEKYEEAIEYLNRANKIDSFISEVYSLLGYCYFCIDNQDAALKNYKLAMSYSDDKYTTLYDYLFILAEYGLYKEAKHILDSYNISESVLKENIELLGSIVSEIYYNNGEKKKAIRLLEQAMSILPENEEFKSNYQLLLENDL